MGGLLGHDQVAALGREQPLPNGHIPNPEFAAYQVKIPDVQQMLRAGLTVIAALQRVVKAPAARPSSASAE